MLRAQIAYIEMQLTRPEHTPVLDHYRPTRWQLKHGHAFSLSVHPGALSLHGPLKYHRPRRLPTCGGVSGAAVRLLHGGRLPAEAPFCAQDQSTPNLSSDAGRYGAKADHEAR